MFSKIKDEKNDCAICLSSMSSEEELYNLRCLDIKKKQTAHHEYHQKCIYTWFETGSFGCPICRVSFIDEAVIQEFEDILSYNQPHIGDLRKILNKYPILVRYVCKKDENVSMLHRLSRRGLYRSVKVFIDYGADINVCDINGETPLHYASAAKMLRTVEVLCEAACKIACEKKEGFLCKAGCQLGKDSVSKYTNTIDNSGKTALHYAAANGAVDVAIALLLYQANPNIQCDSGYTPLHCAAANKRKFTAGVLIKYYADPTIKNNFHEMALDFIPYHSRNAWIKVLFPKK